MQNAPIPSPQGGFHPICQYREHKPVVKTIILFLPSCKPAYSFLRLPCWSWFGLVR